MPSKKTVEDKMLAFIRDELFEEGEFGENSETIADQPLELLGLQSIELMELVFFVEREFNCRLEASSLAPEHLLSIETLASEVHRQISSIEHAKAEL